MSEEKQEEFIYIEGYSKELQDILRKGQKIAAIKSVREEKGMGLKEAKEYTEELELKMAEENESFAFQKRAGCGALLAVSGGSAVMLRMLFENIWV